MLKLRVGVGASLLWAVGLLAGCGGAELRVAVGPDGSLYLPLDDQGRLGSYARATDLYRISPDALTRWRLAKTEGVREGWVQVSPDGKRLLYVSITPKTDDASATATYKLILSDLDGQNAQTLVESEERLFSPSFAPTGHRIAYAQSEKREISRYSIFVFDPEIRESSPVAQALSMPGLWMLMVWSPSADALTFIEYRAEPHEQNPSIIYSELVQLGLDGHREVLLSGAGRVSAAGEWVWTEGITPVGFVAWAPDGQSLVFTGFEQGAPSAEGEPGSLLGGLYRLTLPDRAVQRLYTQRFSEGHMSLFPVFSPDGAYLAFTVVVSAPLLQSPSLTPEHPEMPVGDLYVLDLAQRQVISEIAGVNPLIPPFWKDAQRIGYATPDQGLWLHDLESGRRVDLLAGKYWEEDLLEKLMQLEAHWQATQEAQQSLSAKLEAQQSQLEETARALGDLRSQLETRAGELKALEQDLQNVKNEAAGNLSKTKTDLEQLLRTEVSDRQGQVASVYLLVLILVAALGFWVWWRTRSGT